MRLGRQGVKALPIFHNMIEYKSIGIVDGGDGVENMDMFENDTAIEMAKRLLVDSIWKSANVEGLGTTFPKTEAILANAPTNTKTEEVLFVVNMKRAWQFLLDNLSYPSSFMLLREFNKIVGNLLFSNAGAIRKIPVQIGGTLWEPEIPKEDNVIDELAKIEQIEDVELRALSYFCYVIRTHIFDSGNKRVAQLIANKVLIEHNIGIFQIDLEYQKQFYNLLLQFYETDDSSAIVSFLKENCIKRLR